MYRRLLILCALTSILLGMAVCYKSNDTYDRERVVLLHGPKGTCTGVSVKAPSGKLYTLTARHCSDMLVKDKILARLEDETEVELKLVAIDPKSDLMLLSASMGESTKVASSVGKHERVHTMTHGLGMPSYRTEGEYLIIQDVPVISGYAMSLQQIKECQAKHGTIEMLVIIPVCSIKYHVMMMTAAVEPGSSGGPVFNSSEKLVGIVSLKGEDGLSGATPLESIITFLKDK